MANGFSSLHPYDTTNRLQPFDNRLLDEDGYFAMCLSAEHNTTQTACMSIARGGRGSACLTNTNPSDYYTYTTNLTFTNSTFCPHSVFMCFVWI